MSSQVCAHEAQAGNAPQRPAARLASHQAQSPALMAARTQWLDTQRAEQLVEPNSARGQAMVSMQSHGEPLPRCFSVPGARLDTTRAERVWTLCIRQRQSRVVSAPHL